MNLFPTVLPRFGSSCLRSLRLLPGVVDWTVDRRAVILQKIGRVFSAPEAAFFRICDLPDFFMNSAWPPGQMPTTGRHDEQRGILEPASSFAGQPLRTMRGKQSMKIQPIKF